MCLGAGQGQARKGVHARCDFQQKFNGEIGERTSSKNFTNTFYYPSICVGVWSHVCGFPHVCGGRRTITGVRPLSPPLELGPWTGWVTGVTNCRAIQLAQGGMLLLKLFLRLLPSLLGPLLEVLPGDFTD